MLFRSLVFAGKFAYGGSMKTYVALLRGVMPTGKNKVPMAKLREVLSDNGFADVRTYIASGNVLVSSKLAPEKIETKIEKLITQHIGAELPVMVRTYLELKKVLAENPFTKGERADGC